MQEAISSTSAVESRAEVWASQMRNSTVPKPWCGPDAPPDLGLLDDRAGAHQEVDVVGVGVPAAEGVRDAAAGKALGEDLAAHGVQARVAAVQEGRVGRHRQELRKHWAEPIAHPHRPLGSPDAHVHVKAEGVVAPGHVLQPLLHPAIVLGVDDLLLLPRAPGVGAGGGQQGPLLAGHAEQASPGLALSCEGVSQVLAPPRPDLDLRPDQLAGHRLGQHGIALGRVPQLVEALRQRQRVRVEDPELLLDADRVVGRGLEDLVDARHVEHGLRYVR